MKNKYTFLLLASFLFSAIYLYPEISIAEDVLLWQVGEGGIHAPLPENWHSLTKEEISAFAEMNKGMLQIPGQFVAGFRQRSEKDITASPFIVVFANEEGRITREEMQKTYSWFKKNNELVSGLLPNQVISVTVEDIEYFPERFSIFFQVRAEMENESWTAINKIIFLQNGYLNIVGFAPKDNFFRYSDEIQTFIANIFIPPSLRYEFSKEKQSVFEAPFLQWFSDRWQQILGAAILVGVYFLVFLRGRRQLGEKKV